MTRKKKTKLGKRRNTVNMRHFGWISEIQYSIINFNGNVWYPVSGARRYPTGPNTRRHGDSHRACGGRAGSGRETGRKLRSRLAGSTG